MINPEICMGAAACVRACPEKKALVVVNGAGHLADAAGCIGHGACKSACPVSAIELVFGTARRGVDLPEFSPSFETSSAGVYIAGELGGMGLVANAVRQGVRAVTAVADDLQKKRSGSEDAVDLLVVGAGPAGLAATLMAKERGLSCRTLEREASLGGSVLAYPRGKIVMTTPVTLPLYGKVRLRRVTKEALIELWRDVVKVTGIEFEFDVLVTGAKRVDDVFEVQTSRGELRARRVLLATGRRGKPRTLGVDGEELSHVHSQLVDAALHDGEACLIVGGGDSAVEAARALAERPGTRITLSYRQSAFGRVKPENREAIEQLASDGRVRLMLGSQVQSITQQTARLKDAEGEHVVDADRVFVLIGRELPNKLLAGFGVELRTYRGEAPGFV
ncbi:MAG: NAD(P)-binding domain-containing protein [Deltaproteobacteria bacterium]|nr:NAD(P)-binding domain-containing protein [Deltaproteobacteria bacterium]